MFLSIDIGNTNIDLGLFQDERLLLHDAFQTPSSGLEIDLRELLRTRLAPHLHAAELTGVGVGSVVAGLGDVLVGACKDLCSGPVLQATADWDLGLSIAYDDPSCVGIDRLLTAVAAFARTPEGSSSIVADAGTAITVDAVDPAGTFLGGLIAPGLHLMLDSLHARANLLPAVELDDDPPLLGRNTSACLQAGTVHGTAAMLDGLFDRIADRSKTPVCGFLTGGDGALLSRHTARFAHCDPALVLYGLRLAFGRQQGRSY